MGSQERMNWFAAQENCWDLGGYLAEITNDAQEAQIETILSEEFNYWIGLNDIVTEGTFRWQESHEIAVYTNWHAGEPNNAKDGEDCVMKDSNTRMEWAD